MLLQVLVQHLGMSENYSIRRDGFFSMSSLQVSAANLLYHALANVFEATRKVNYIMVWCIIDFADGSL